MKKAVVLLVALFVFSGLASPQTAPNASAAGKIPTSQIKFMTVDEVRPGMKGVAYTVFEGVRPEAMDVEVLGLLRNMNGPKNDVVLVRLHGEKPEYTGVVSGMSGSPVYIDGKLLGAIAYRMGTFSKEPIAGVTPIQQMLEINEFDRSIPPAGSAPRPDNTKKAGSPSAVSAGGSGGYDLQSYAQILQPIGAPIVFNGFDEATINVSDGLRLDFPDGWLHLRTSNTEPVMRVIVEARDEAAARRYIEAVLDIRRAVLGQA